MINNNVVTMVGRYANGRCGLDSSGCGLELLPQGQQLWREVGGA